MATSTCSRSSARRCASFTSTTRFRRWASLVARAPAAILGRGSDHGVIAAGRAADLVLFRARNWTELLARPQSDRTVVRAGHAIDRTLPDYRELDDLVGVG